MSSAGGAQQLRLVDKVRVKLNSSYRHYLDGLIGTVTCVMHHGVIVDLSGTPQELQRVLGAGGAVGPANPPPQQAVFQFNEVERIP